MASVSVALDLTTAIAIDKNTVIQVVSVRYSNKVDRINAASMDLPYEGSVVVCVMCAFTTLTVWVQTLDYIWGYRSSPW